MSDSLKTTGAPSVLAYASERELAARKDWHTSEEVLKKCLKLQLDRPKKLDGTDFDGDVSIATLQRDAAFARWKEAADMVYKFDKSVDPSKRDASEKMSRDEVTALISMVQIYFRTNVHSLIMSLCSALPSVRTEIELHKLIADKVIECGKTAFDSANREGHIPDWCKEAMLGK